MTLILNNQVFQQHDTGRHPETPKRLAQIERHFGDRDAALPQTADLNEVDTELLLKIHDPQVKATAKAISANGGGAIDADTICSEESYHVALLAAGTAVRAVDAVLSGEHPNSLCLIRPPGHHATPKQSMGFCIFNNIAIAAQHARDHHDLSRIMIVDWDVHHGNGTQDIFYDRDDVFFLSSHRYPFYPGTGSKEESGTGSGLGYTCNLPMEYGLGRQAMLEQFQSGLERCADQFKPELILISAGFDAHKDDPVGSLGLESQDFLSLTQMVQDVANMHCQGKIVSCLEGGYNLDALAESVDFHIQGLSAEG